MLALCRLVFVRFSNIFELDPLRALSDVLIGTQLVKASPSEGKLWFDSQPGPNFLHIFALLRKDVPCSSGVAADDARLIGSERSVLRSARRVIHPCETFAASQLPSLSTRFSSLLPPHPQRDERSERRERSANRASVASIQTGIEAIQV